MGRTDHQATIIKDIAPRQEQPNSTQLFPSLSKRRLNTEAYYSLSESCFLFPGLYRKDADGEADDGRYHRFDNAAVA